MSFDALGPHSRIRALGICLLSLALPLFLGSCNGGASGSSSSSAQMPINAAGRLVGFPVHIRRRAEALFHVFENTTFAPWVISAGAQPPVLSGPEQGRPSPQHKPRSMNSTSMSRREIRTGPGRRPSTWDSTAPTADSGGNGRSTGGKPSSGFKATERQAASSRANRNPDGSWAPAIDPGPGINDHSAGVFQDKPAPLRRWKKKRFGSPPTAPMGLGGRDIWSSSQFETEGWSAPVNVGAPVNTAADDDEFWFSAASPDLYWKPTPGRSCTALPPASTCFGSSRSVGRFPAANFRPSPP